MSARIAARIGTVVYAVVFAWVYPSLVAQTWAYSGLIYHPPEDASIVAGLAAAVIPGLVLPTHADRPSRVVAWILYAIAYVPASLVPYYISGLGTRLFPLTLALLCSMLAIAAACRGPTPQLRLSLLSERQHRWIVVFGAVALWLYIVAHFGLSFHAPDLENVYDIRADYKDVVEDVGGLLGYAVGTSASAMNPMLIAIGTARRQYSLIALGLAGEVFIYSITGYKSILFTGPLVIPLVIALQRYRTWFGAASIAGLTGVVAAAAGSQVIAGENALSALFIRRLLAVPGQLTSYYYEFFTSNPTYALSHSVLGWLTDPPYPVTPPRLIASLYFANPAANANANIWADGMANFGLPGILVMTVFLVVVLKLMDAAAVGRPLEIAGATIGAAAFSWTNSALLTSLLSHGIGVAILLVLLMPATSPRRSAQPAPESRVLKPLGDRHSPPSTAVAPPQFRGT